MKIPLYKAISLETRTWIEGNLVYNLDPTRKEPVIKEAFIRNPVGKSTRLVPVAIKTICEFTGLTDKNGIKVFFNDNVMLDHWKSTDLFDYSNPFIVSFFDGEINFKQRDYNLFKGTLNGKLTIDVFGNIYDPC